MTIEFELKDKPMVLGPYELCWTITIIVILCMIFVLPWKRWDCEYKEQLIEDSLRYAEDVITTQVRNREYLAKVELTLDEVKEVRALLSRIKTNGWISLYYDKERTHKSIGTDLRG